MHMYLDGPNKCNPIIFKSVSKTPNITSEGETVLCLLRFPDFFLIQIIFGGKVVQRSNIFLGILLFIKSVFGHPNMDLQ